jgi:hypothetical protein
MAHERTVYRFKSGKFEGKTMELVMLRYGPDLYWRVGWARDKPHLWRMVRGFEQLRTQLSHGPIVVHCAESGCRRTPNRMTLPLGYDGYYWPDPTFWCRKHDESREDGAPSVMLLLSFDTLESFRQKKNRAAVHRALLTALGITKHRSRISEKYARDFFAKLSSSD